MTVMDKAKALVGALLTGGAVWASRRYGIDVPPEAVSLASDLIATGLGAVCAGFLVWLVPNKKPA